MPLLVQAYGLPIIAAAQAAMHIMIQSVGNQPHSAIGKYEVAARSVRAAKSKRSIESAVGLEGNVGPAANITVIADV